MDNQTVNTYYVALQPPYKIIKHGNKIGVQIGTQRVVVAGGNPFRTETHDYPVVAAENRIAALKDNDYRLDGSSDGEIWDNVETKNVSVLCDAGVCLEWEQFIEILWHDHARLGNPRQQINKVYLFNKIVSYNKHMMLPPPDLYTLHLHTLISEEGFPYVVRTKKEDVFALNVEWSDNLIELENRLVSDLKSYLLILSPNRRTNFWQMHYETEEDRLRPLMERLNANPKATSFRNQIMASFTVKAIPPYEKKESQNTNMAESVIDKISANNIRYYYEGWRNGKHGSICQTMGIYRFVEMAYVKSGILDDVNKNEEDNPIVAKGIVAYWLQFNSRMDTVIKRLTKYNCEIPKDIREQFDNYTQIRFEQFRREHRDDPETWDWDWDREFYANAIIPHEIAFNKQSEALFDYISDSDIALVRSVMNSYIKYLKKIRTEKGYLVNPELLVLRAIATGDSTKQEDLEEFEVNTILDNLEEKGYIHVAWIEGHKPEGVRLFDKGRVYLKQLEEGRVVVETKSIVTPQQQPKDGTAEIPPQTPHIPQTPKGSGQEEIEEEEWDDTFDYIFDERVRPQEIKRTIETVKSEKVKDRRFHYVAYRILKVIKWIPVEISESDYLRWINCHFKCGWENNKNQKKAFLFNLEGTVKKLDDLHPSEWKDDSLYGKLGKHYRLLAISFKNAFTYTMIDKKPIGDSESYEHLKDRVEFLSGAREYHGALWAHDEAYINDGK